MLQPPDAGIDEEKKCGKQERDQEMQRHSQGHHFIASGKSLFAKKGACDVFEDRLGLCAALYEILDNGGGTVG